MLTIQAQNVNDAYAEALWKLKVIGIKSSSRNGDVIKMPYPVATTYLYPKQRMLLDEKRDANPFFHIFEAIWMLAGRNDLAFLEQFNSNIHQYAEEEGYFHGAYGFRWRFHYGHDQLEWVIEHLREEPTSRRAVLQMYDPEFDQCDPSDMPKDIPCNTTIYFSISQGELNMTVCCRSNDVVWGCYGANAVHMSILQEFVAGAVGVEVGKYVQFSNDFHIYERHFPLMERRQEGRDYTQYMIDHHQSLTDSRHWKGDLRQFEDWCEHPYGAFDAPYIANVLAPMLRSWEMYKQKNLEKAKEETEGIVDVAVRIACLEWLGRRK